MLSPPLRRERGVDTCGEHPKLDERYERLFEVKGYIPVIATAAELVRGFGGEISMSATAGALSNGASIQSHIKPAPDLNGHTKADLPVLPPDPTDEDLLRYAESHPAIRKVVDMFKASIVEVTRKVD